MRARALVAAAIVVLSALPSLAQVPADLLGRWTTRADSCDDDVAAGAAVLGLTPTGIGWLDIDCDIVDAQARAKTAELSVSCFKGAGRTGKGRIDIARKGPEAIEVHVLPGGEVAGEERFQLTRCAGEAGQLSEAVKSSRWSHNGSTLVLYAEGSTRAFYYDRPRAGMIAAGARRGRLLFKGEITGEAYEGIAYVFNARCGALPYAVGGPILDEHRRVVMKGKAPRVGENCKVVGHVDDTLEFELLGK